VLQDLGLHVSAASLCVGKGSTAAPAEREGALFVTPTGQEPTQEAGGAHAPSPLHCSMHAAESDQRGPHFLAAMQMPHVVHAPHSMNGPSSATTFLLLLQMSTCRMTHTGG
jgi:hypothetical protein